MLTLLAAFAQWYLDHLSLETAKGKQAEAGHWNSAIPFGYRVEYAKCSGDGLAHLVEDELPRVRLAFERYLSGLCSDSDIARILNEAGYRPRGRGDRALALFSKDPVTDRLQNRFYLGEVQYKGKWYPGLHEPIISEQVFSQAQEARRRRRKGFATRARGGSKEYPLAGVARCARWGWPMRGSFTK